MQEITTVKVKEVDVKGLDVESRKDHSLPQNNTPDMDDAEQEAIVYLHGRQSQLTPGSSTKECH